MFPSSKRLLGFCNIDTDENCDIDSSNLFLATTI